MEKIWLKSYPKNIPAEINPDDYRSLADLFDQCFDRYKNLPAFANLGTTLTFQNINDYSTAVAAYFQHQLNLKKGDRVAIMLPNVLQYPIVMFGALRAGLVVVNVNPLYTPPELIHQLQDAEASTIIVLANFAETVQQAIEDSRLKNINVIVTQMGDLFPPLKALLINGYLKWIAKRIPQYNIPNAISFKQVIAQGKKLHFNPVPLAHQDIAFLQYTGGTTGISKGAMLTHRNIIANIMQANAWFAPRFEHGKEIIITALPLYHIFSLTANCLFIFSLGGLNVLITNPRDTKKLISEMARYRFSVLTGVNTLFNALIKRPEFSQLNFSGLKVSLGGGMAVQRAVADKWQKVTGLPINEGYGLTEASPCVAINLYNLTEYTGTVGLPVSSTDAIILNDEGNEVALGEPGELAIKGPQVMYGYWRNPSETQKVFTKDGWLLTGDIASIDAKGFVQIRERKKDMIVVSGFNVYPNEVEDILARLHGIREVAVIGVSDDNSGEAVKAFIVKDDPNLMAADVIAYCHKNLTGYKVPKTIEFVDDLPKSNVGKILRRALRDRMMQGEKLLS